MPKTSTPPAPVNPFAKRFPDSINDHGLACPTCWHTTTEAILTSGKVKPSEAVASLKEMAELADKSGPCLDAADVLPFILENLQAFGLHGDRAFSTLRRIIDKMGHAANAAK